MYKSDSGSKCIASFFGGYINDIQNIFINEKAFQDNTRTVVFMVNHLRKKYDPRKSRSSLKSPGAWYGAMCLAREYSGYYITCSHYKQEKGKVNLKKWIYEVINGNIDTLDYNKLYKGLDFLVHIIWIFP